MTTEVLDAQYPVPLTSEDLDEFARTGYVRVKEALSASYVERIQEVIWSQLHEKAGVVRDDPTTYRAGWVGVNRELLDKAVRPEITPRLKAAADQLLGESNWRPLKTLGGLLMTMPGQATGEWEVPTRIWHADNPPEYYRDAMTEVMLFTFYSQVAPTGGGTLILSGSHLLFEKYFAENETASLARVADFDPFNLWHPYLAELTGIIPRTRTAQDWFAPETVHGMDVRVVELTGEPGDAILCHPAVYHAVAPNVLPVPRIMRRTNFRRKK